MGRTCRIEYSHLKLQEKCFNLSHSQSVYILQIGHQKMLTGNHYTMQVVWGHENHPLWKHKYATHTTILLQSCCAYSLLMDRRHGVNWVACSTLASCCSKNQEDLWNTRLFQPLPEVGKEKKKQHFVCVWAWYIVLLLDFLLINTGGISFFQRTRLKITKDYSKINKFPAGNVFRRMRISIS